MFTLLDHPYEPVVVLCSHGDLGSDAGGFGIVHAHPFREGRIRMIGDARLLHENVSAVASADGENRRRAFLLAEFLLVKAGERPRSLLGCHAEPAAAPLDRKSTRL